jgi:uncharacterized membrane protein
MNGYFLFGFFLALSIFTLGVRVNRDPGDLNGVIGYRSSRSIKNDDTWYEANVFAGRSLMIMAVILLIIISIAEVLKMKANFMFMLMAVYIVLCSILLIFLTEKHLKRNFFRDGKRKPTSL